ncbi:hypothetical protein QYM36_020021 [Artemia franciscana]|uniref:Secreted protein n=1 Tax=Artemia franciscana TaxID=6661 RepID=A0AA88KTD3_ARTSF|nr:hypothetical protein QYM36_020021 [Artemia franciscana]
MRIIALLSILIRTFAITSPKSSSRDIHPGCENESEEELKEYGDHSDNGEEEEFPEDIRASPAVDFAFDKE